MTELKVPRMKYDPTISLGTIISAAAFLGSGFAVYGTMDKRVTVLEEKATMAVQASSERASQTAETLREIKGDVKELTQSVNQLRIERGK